MSLSESEQSQRDRPAGGGMGRAPEADPDAQGLPPHVVLPEAHAFMRDQLRARLLVSLAALAVLGVIVWASDEYRQMYTLCAGGAALAVLVLGVRYIIARQKAAKQEESRSSKR